MDYIRNGYTFNGLYPSFLYFYRLPHPSFISSSVSLPFSLPPPFVCSLLLSLFPCSQFSSFFSFTLLLFFLLLSHCLAPPCCASCPFMISFSFYLYLRSVIDRIKSFLRSAVIRKKSPFFLQILPLSPRVMLVISTTRICSVHLLREKKSNTPQSAAADALICIAGGFFYAIGAD